MDEDAPQHKVDEVYLKVLSFPRLSQWRASSKARFFNDVERILGFTAVLFESASVLSLSEFLSLGIEKLEETLRKLHSILDVREDRNKPLIFVHLSSATSF